MHDGGGGHIGGHAGGSHIGGHAPHTGHQPGTHHPVTHHSHRHHGQDDSVWNAVPPGRHRLGRPGRARGIAGIGVIVAILLIVVLIVAS
jgi:hypothetical protein